MEIQKAGRKWAVKGKGNEWIFKKNFPTKWKAAVALGVFEKGGSILDYRKDFRKAARPKREALKVIE